MKSYYYAYKRLVARIILPTGLLILANSCAYETSVPPNSNLKQSTNKMGQPSFAHFPDIPIPSGSKMNTEKTFLFGPPESWIGRLVIENRTNSGKIFDHFKQRTPELGWQEITSIRSANSHLVYSRLNRILTIQINTKTLIGSEIIMIVSPSKNSPSDKSVTITPLGK